MTNKKPSGEVVCHYCHNPGIWMHMLCSGCPQVSKLDPKSLKCIFVGYFRVQKGIGVIIPLFDVILCQLMLHSLRLPRFPFHLLL